MDNTKRDQEIAAQFLGGLSVPRLANLYNLSEPHINRILELQEVDRSKRVKLATSEKSIDHSHVKIGGRLYAFRQFEAFEDRLTCSKVMGWSAKKIAMVEQGHTVLSLTDLQAIAKYMKKSLSELLKDI